jgi:hypothetical protein
MMMCRCLFTCSTLGEWNAKGQPRKLLTAIRRTNSGYGACVNAPRSMRWSVYISSRLCPHGVIARSSKAQFAASQGDEEYTVKSDDVSHKHGRDAVTCIGSLE